MMFGAGAWNVHCFLCGLPFSAQPDDGPAPTDVDLEWLECGSGFDPNRDAIVTVETDDGYGRFPIYGRPGRVFCVDEGHVPERDAHICTHVGVVCHEDCHEFVEKTIGHAVSARTMADLYHQSDHTRDYRGQFFRWAEAHAREGLAYFHSPMSADGSHARGRITRCLASYTGGRVATPVVQPARLPTRAQSGKPGVGAKPFERSTSPRTKSPRTKSPRSGPRTTQPRKTKAV
jgi:hypothetical protein